MKIDWAALHLNPQLMQIAKAFVAYALEKYAPVTAFKASGVFGRLAESEISAKFPWARQELVTTISNWAKFRESTIFFRTFYRYALNRGILGFDKETYLALKEIKTSRLDPYESIFLSQSGLALDEEIRLLQRIERDIQTEEWSEAQLNMMLHLSFELGPRSIQFHSLDIADFEFIESADHERYYTLWLPMAKKVGQRRPERRPRKITTRLGEKTSQHISEMKRRFGEDCEPLFLTPNGRRMSVTEIGVSLKHELREAGIDKPNQVTMLLRHHLGQGLADQGTPADMIAELLGHNSTVAARAYVTATPNMELESVMVTR